MSAMTDPPATAGSAAPAATADAAEASGSRRWWSLRRLVRGRPGDPAWVRPVLLALLGGTAGVIAAMLGFNEGISPIILIGILILYYSTVQSIFAKLGIAKPAPAASNVTGSIK